MGRERREERKRRGKKKRATNIQGGREIKSSCAFEREAVKKMES